MRERHLPSADSRQQRRDKEKRIVEKQRAKQHAPAKSRPNTTGEPSQTSSIMCCLADPLDGEPPEITKEMARLKVSGAYDFLNQLSSNVRQNLLRKASQLIGSPPNSPELRRKIQCRRCLHILEQESGSSTASVAAPSIRTDVSAGRTGGEHVTQPSQHGSATRHSHHKRRLSSAVRDTNVSKVAVGLNQRKFQRSTHTPNSQGTSLAAAGIGSKKAQRYHHRHRQHQAATASICTSNGVDTSEEHELPPIPLEIEQAEIEVAPLEPRVSTRDPPQRTFDSDLLLTDLNTPKVATFLEHASPKKRNAFLQERRRERSRVHKRRSNVRKWALINQLHLVKERSNTILNQKREQVHQLHCQISSALLQRAAAREAASLTQAPHRDTQTSH